MKCCSDGQRSGKTCRRRIIKWGQKKRMCNGLRRVEKVKMILIKSKANDANDDVADDNDDIFLRHWWLWPPCCRRTLQVQSLLAEKGSRRTGLDLDAGGSFVRLNKTIRAYVFIYDSFSDVGESRVWFVSKNLTPCTMHWNAFLIAQIIAKCHSFPNMYDML